MHPFYRAMPERPSPDTLDWMWHERTLDGCLALLRELRGYLHGALVPTPTAHQLRQARNLRISIRYGSAYIRSLTRQVLDRG